MIQQLFLSTEGTYLISILFKFNEEIKNFIMLLQFHKRKSKFKSQGVKTRQFLTEHGNISRIAIAVLSKSAPTLSIFKPKLTYVIECQILKLLA